MLTAAGGQHPYSCAYSGRKAGSARSPTERGGSFFFFRGKIILANPVYSQGVRQKVYTLHHQRQNWIISDQSSKNFYQEMMRAVFCFAPTGKPSSATQRAAAQPHRRAHPSLRPLPARSRHLCVPRLGLGPARI